MSKRLGLYHQLSSDPRAYFFFLESCLHCISLFKHNHTRAVSGVTDTIDSVVAMRPLVSPVEGVQFISIASHLSQEETNAFLMGPSITSILHQMRDFAVKQVEAEQAAAGGKVGVRELGGDDGGGDGDRRKSPRRLASSHPTGTVFDLDTDAVKCWTEVQTIARDLCCKLEKAGQPRAGQTLVTPHFVSTIVTLIHGLCDDEEAAVAGRTVDRFLCSLNRILSRHNESSGASDVWLTKPFYSALLRLIGHATRIIDYISLLTLMSTFMDTSPKGPLFLSRVEMLDGACRMVCATCQATEGLKVSSGFRAFKSLLTEAFIMFCNCIMRDDNPITIRAFRQCPHLIEALALAGNREEVVASDREKTNTFLEVWCGIVIAVDKLADGTTVYVEEVVRVFYRYLMESNCTNVINTVCSVIYSNAADFTPFCGGDAKLAERAASLILDTALPAEARQHRISAAFSIMCAWMWCHRGGYPHSTETPPPLHRNLHIRRRPPLPLHLLS